MFKLIINLLLVIMLSANTMAAPFQKLSISDVVIKYDYLLNAHPQAHEDSFRKETIESYKNELIEASKGLSKEMLLKNLDVLLAEIVDESLRAELRKELLSSTQEDIEGFLQNPDVFSKHLSGDGAHFALKKIEPERLVQIIAMTVVVGFVIGFITWTVIESRKYERFYSSHSSTVSSHLCAPDTSNLAVSNALTDYSKNRLKESALANCLAGATHPQTCEYDGWYSSGGFYDDHGVYQASNCDIKAVYKAKKELEQN